MIWAELKAVDITWLTEEVYCDALEVASKHSGVDPYRMQQLWWMVGQSAKLHGELLEVGCANGGTGYMIAKSAEHHGINAKLTMCDTFAGLVKSDDSIDVLKNGDMANASEDSVRALMGPEVAVLRGVFPDETGHHLSDKVFRFAHIDVDIYKSGKDIFQWLWPRMVRHGIVVFDDYQIPDTPGITKLVEEIDAQNDSIWFRDCMGQAIGVKL